MGDSDSGYEFGSGEDELARLEVQGQALGPATRMIFAATGMRGRQPGRRVRGSPHRHGHGQQPRQPASRPSRPSLPRRAITAGRRPEVAER